jgi:hypothetical protein
MSDLLLCSFSFEALDKLVLARRVLQWTYALAYYFKSGGQKSLFEYQQELLCGATESLQDIVDHNYSDLDRIIQLRKDIINKTAAIDKFRVEMVAQVERGEFEHLLLADADAGLEKWACVSCKQDNAKNLTVRGKRGNTQTGRGRAQRQIRGSEPRAA